MQLYIDYIKEREDKECVYNDNCFITYKIYGEDVSVIDIYSSPRVRGTGEMRNFVIKFFNDMKEKGVEKAFGYTDEDTNGWEESDRLMKRFGFKHFKKEDNYNHYVLYLEEINNG
jgi:N-acetylglutamate synthase-like GNAT family acetyltransferase